LNTTYAELEAAVALAHTEYEDQRSKIRNIQQEATNRLHKTNVLYELKKKAIEEMDERLTANAQYRNDPGALVCEAKTITIQDHATGKTTVKFEADLSQVPTSQKTAAINHLISGVQLINNLHK
jgi:hypothetical protein